MTDKTEDFRKRLTPHSTREERDARRAVTMRDFLSSDKTEDITDDRLLSDLAVYAATEGGDLADVLEEAADEIKSLRSRLAVAEADRDEWQQEANDQLHRLVAAEEVVKAAEAHVADEYGEGKTFPDGASAVAALERSIAIYDALKTSLSTYHQQKDDPK